MRWLEFSCPKFTLAAETSMDLMSGELGKYPKLREQSEGAWAVVQERGDAGINGGILQGGRGGRGIGPVGDGRPWKQLFLRWGRGAGHGVVFPERSSAKTQMFLPPGPHQGPRLGTAPLRSVVQICVIEWDSGGTQDRWSGPVVRVWSLLPILKS